LHVCCLRRYSRERGYRELSQTADIADVASERPRGRCLYALWFYLCSFLAFLSFFLLLPPSLSSHFPCALALALVRLVVSCAKNPAIDAPVATAKLPKTKTSMPHFMNKEALCAAPPEAPSHSTSQTPLSCPVAPPSQHTASYKTAAAVVVPSLAPTFAG